MVKRRQSKSKKQPPILQRAYLAIRLKQLRQARGFETARAFAVAIDQSESAYRRYEAGEAEPDLRLYYTMIEVLGVTAVDLLGSYRELHAAASGGPAKAIGRSGFAEPGEASGADDLDRAIANEAAIWSLADAFLALVEKRDPGTPDAQLEKFRKLSSLADMIRAAPHKAILELSADARMATAPAERRARFKAAADRVADLDYPAT